MSEYKILPMNEVDYGDTYGDPLRPEIYEEVGIVRWNSRTDAQYYDIGWWDSKDNGWYQWETNDRTKRELIDEEVVCWFKLIPWDEI